MTIETGRQNLTRKEELDDYYVLEVKSLMQNLVHDILQCLPDDNWL